MGEFTGEGIAAVLKTRQLGRPVLFYEKIGSTNDVAKQRGAEGAAEGLLVVTDEQTAGRGRETRSWWAPPGSSLLMSLLLRPPLRPAEAQQATMCLGLGAVEGIRRVTGLDVRLKWPNDLLLHGRKLAGMLTEMDVLGDRLNWVVLGMGINVNLDFKSLTGEVATRDGTGSGVSDAPPPDVAALAISLSEALGRPVERPVLLAAILEATEGWYERLLRGESPHAAWSAHVDTVGRLVNVTLGDRVLHGAAIGVNPQGALLVRDDAGLVHTVWAGDVTTTRIAADDPHAAR